LKLVARPGRDHFLFDLQFALSATSVDEWLLSNAKVVTTTLSYDNNGNLTSSGTSSFSWNYRNQLTQAVTQNSTTTYAYDDQGNRVSQTVGNTTIIYPNKYYSITSTTNGGTTYATTTVYVWNGDTLIATIDQPIINGAATGTAATRYIHPDHLGSTNVVSDESGNVVDSLEYYPYGETRINEPTYPTNAQRQYIAQFKDGNSLSYLNARYLNSQQGQFLSEDPVFLGVPSEQNLGDPQSLTSPWATHSASNLASASGLSGNTQPRGNSTSGWPDWWLLDPQMQNAYGYGRDNPTRYADPNGNFIAGAIPVILFFYGAAQTGVDAWDAYNMNIKYADVTTPEEKSTSGFKAGFDVLTWGVGKAATQLGMSGYCLALSGLQATGDTLDFFYGPQIYQNLNSRQVQSKIFTQGRQQFVQNYNASFGLSTGGGGGKSPNNNSLWVTPSGAIVTFGGQLFAPPAKQQ
jgi:YD repeat-containing protein